MNTIVLARLRTGLVCAALLAGLGGCADVQSTAARVGASIERVAARIAHPAAPAAVPAAVPAPAGLDDYKTRVARQVVERNPERSYSGALPPLLPAIVVLEITVDRDGELADMAVQRARDPDAARVALASMRRSTPLPRPQQLERADGTLKFSETFLFADHERYQLRSLAGPQASD